MLIRRNVFFSEDLRQMEEREYVKRIKEDIQQRQMAYAYRTLSCHGGLILTFTQDFSFYLELAKFETNLT